jgi:hypothetical protein
MLASEPQNTKLVTGPPRLKKIFCKAPTRGCERDATAFHVKACMPCHELVMCNKLIGSLGWKERTGLRRPSLTLIWRPEHAIDDPSVLTDA